VQGKTTAKCAKDASWKGRRVIPEIPVGQYKVESTAIAWGGHYPDEEEEVPGNEGMLLHGEVAELLGQVSPPCMRRAM